MLTLQPQWGESRIRHPLRLAPQQLGQTVNHAAIYGSGSHSFRSVAQPALRTHLPSLFVHKLSASHRQTKIASSERYQGDAWDGPIRHYLEYITAQNEGVTVAEILEKALGMEKARWTQADQNRVVRTLTSMSFRQYRARVGGHGNSAQRERRYRWNSLGWDQTA